MADSKTVVEFCCDPEEYLQLGGVADQQNQLFSKCYIPAEHAWDWFNNRPFKGRAYFTFLNARAAMMFKLASAV